MDFKDYYVSLGVAPDADDKTIKKAYQKLAKKYHPDVNPGDKSAEDKFKEASEAYQAISDPEKRQKYDELRQDYQQWKTRGSRDEYNWGRWQSEPRSNGGGNQGYTMSQDEFAEMFGGRGNAGGYTSSGGDDYSDFFSSLFGGAAGRGNGRGNTAPIPRSGQDHVAEVQVTLEESYHGTNRVIQTGEKKIEAKIPKGVRTGSKVRLSGQGGQGVSGGSRGDLFLNITVKPDERFVRDGDDLKMTLEIDFFRAVLGGEIKLPTFDGELMLKIPPLSQSGKRFRLKGKGMPNLEHSTQKGDLFAELSIVLPKELSEQEITQLRELSDKREVK